MSIVIDYTKGFFEAAPSGETVGDIATGTLDLATGNVFSYTPAADTTFVFSNPPATGTAYGMTLKVTGADVTAEYDIANAVYDSVSFSVAGQDTVPAGIFFKPDGTKMYVVGFSSRSVHQYTLSTAYDLSTASYDSVSFSFTAQSTGPVDISFKPDGTKMYMLADSGDAVHQYSLSTAYDLSTASYDSVSFSVAAQSTGPQGFFFKPDGTKMYVATFSSGTIFQYALSTAFDLSTASYDSVSFSAVTQGTTASSVQIRPDGLKMYILMAGNDTVYQYTLSTAYDISTASYDSISFSLAVQDNAAYGVIFSTDGTKMYMVGYTGDAVYQYTTGTATPATFTYPTAVDWPSATAPTAPATGETDVYTFYTTDGGTTYYGFQVGDAMA